jgi:8-oxo-dGTP pyrophosphatase MutT (NUDIX family)
MNNKKAKKIVRKGGALEQVAALPYRRLPSGVTELLLLTSRQTSRFVIPKGWRMKGVPDPQAAAKEAEQEAGVRGQPGRRPVGTYQYWKRLADAFVPVSVVVYGLKVETELPDWKERNERRKRWLSPEQAATLVDEPGLASLIKAFGQ